MAFYSNAAINSKGIHSPASCKRADHMDNGKVEHVDKTVVEKGRGRRDNSGLLK